MAVTSNVSTTNFIVTSPRDMGPVTNSANNLGDLYGTSKALNGNICEVLDLTTGTVYVGTNGVLLGDGGILRYIYEPAVDGRLSATGNIGLRGVPIPPNFRIDDVSFDVQVALTGSGASISIGTAPFTINPTTETFTLGAVTATNLYGTTAIGTAGAVGKRQGIPDLATVGDAVLTTTEVLPVIVITGANLDAVGRMIITIRGTKVR
jgi:hypothetical protein